MKLTKKSYNRRMFALGALLFLSIGLVSTGFAAFVMSKGAKENETGHIQVGTITDGAVKFENVKFKDNKDLILFEAAENDTNGEVKWDGTNHDILEVTLEGSVTPATYVQGVTIELNSTNAGIKAAADAGYIVLPSCYGEGNAQTVTTTPNGSDPTKLDFSYTLTFGWGTKFGNENPSTYLDTFAGVDDGAGGTRGYTYEEKKAILVDFKRTIYSLESTVPEEEVLGWSTVLDFEATLTVTANV